MIFGKLKQRNPRAVGSNRRILDRNVVVEVLFVLGLKKSLLSISTLDAKGMRVAFIDGKVILWPRGKTIDNAVLIREQEGGL